MAYVAQATGAEPTQKEIAAVLASHFTLGEITNQIAYLQRRPPEAEETAPPAGGLKVPWRLNLSGAPSRNSLARAGFFIEAIAASIAGIRKYARTTLGAEPSDEIIALSLTSSFIASELKNQIVYSRKKPPKKKP
jgi:hypothetical protein